MRLKVLRLAILAIILYLLSTTISYTAFSFFGSVKPEIVVTSPIPVPTGVPSSFEIDPNLPRTEACPLNGVKYPKKYRDIWEQRRPLAVMLENSSDSRPQSGLSVADIIYEAVAEGGTTRFLAIYYCGATLGNINLAPVRSARIYFIHWVLEYDALYNHVGGANRYGDNISKTDPRADAIGYIKRYGIKDLDQFSISFPSCYRNYDRLDHPVATEHTMICQSDNLYQIGEQRGWTNVDESGIPWDNNFVTWKFKDDAKEKDRGSISPIEFNFWEGYEEFVVNWQYDRSTNSYLRSTGGKPHQDLETGKQLAAKNVVIQLARERRGIDELGHLLYDTIGSGKALIFKDGKVIVATWKKQSEKSRTLFTTNKGEEVAFNPGQIWIELVPLGNEIIYPK